MDLAAEFLKAMDLSMSSTQEGSSQPFFGLLLKLVINKVNSFYHKSFYVAEKFLFQI